MGMFDWYVPTPTLHCPKCGAAVPVWQGKDGVCCLFEWIQGLAAPARQLVDYECAALEFDRNQVRLPERFGIHAECPGCAVWMQAEGSCEAGVWIRVAFLDPLEPPGLPEGWRSIQEDDRLNVAAELRREIPDGHVLHGVKLTPLGRRVNRDDVLIRATGAPAPLYVVHLTWHAETDPAWPSSQPFRSLIELMEAEED
jgi:hypothetical protein